MLNKFKILNKGWNYLFQSFVLYLSIVISVCFIFQIPFSECVKNTPSFMNALLEFLCETPLFVSMFVILPFFLILFVGVFGLIHVIFTVLADLSCILLTETRRYFKK